MADKPDDKRDAPRSPDRGRIEPGSRDTTSGRRDSSQRGATGQREGANIQGPADSHGRHGGNR